MRTHAGTDGREPARVAVSGWVADATDSTVTIRDQEGVVTLTVADGATDRLSTLVPESIVEVSGDVIEKDGDGYTVESASVEVFSEPDRPLPLDPGAAPDADIEERLDHRHLDLRGERQQAIFRIRSEALRAIRATLRDWGAVECDLPLLVPGVMEAKNDQFRVEYFGEEVRLAGFHTSQYKQLLASGGFERLFAVEKIFGYDDDAAAEIDFEDGGHPLNVNETTTVQIESAFTDHLSFLDVVETLVRRVHEAVRENCGDELATLGVDLPIPGTFPRLTYEECLELANESRETPLSWGEDLDTAATRALGERVGGYYFVVDWPAPLRDFYARAADDGSGLARSFDLMAPEMELMSGCQREHRREEIRRAIDAEPALDADQLEFYLDALGDGVPPHAGGVLGVDRFLTSMLELDNVREVVAFPRDRTRTV